MLFRSKTLRATEAVIAGLANLTGDALKKQQARVNELVATANRQNLEYQKAKAVADSKAIHSAGGGAAAFGASSPHVGRDRNRSGNSARHKQMLASDPEYAGKQVAAQGQAMQAEVGQNPAPPGRGLRHPERVQTRQRQQHQQQFAAGYRYNDEEGFNDGDTAMEAAGYQPRNPYRAHGDALADRLGPRQLGESDMRYRLDRVNRSELIEEEAPQGPACFAARIRREPPVPNFQLPRGTKTYNGSTRPEDWLNDYVSAVHIAGGNRRWAMRYIPRMLEGPARI